MTLNASNMETRTQSAYQVHHFVNFFQTPSIQLRATVGTFAGGQRPGVTFTKSWFDTNKKEWRRSKKAYFMDVSAWKSLLTFQDSIESAIDSLVSSKYNFSTVTFHELDKLCF